MTKTGNLVTGGTGLVGAYVAAMSLEQLGFEPDDPLDKVLADYALTLSKLEAL